MNDSRKGYWARRIYRDSERGMILGVCAGMAESFGWPVWLTRIVVLALGWYFPVTVVVAYVIGALLMQERPLRFYGDGDERACWQSRRRRS